MLGMERRVALLQERLHLSCCMAGRGYLKLCAQAFSLTLTNTYMNQANALRAVAHAVSCAWVVPAAALVGPDPGQSVSGARGCRHLLCQHSFQCRHISLLVAEWRCLAVATTSNDAEGSFLVLHDCETEVAELRACSCSTVRRMCSDCVGAVFLWWDCTHARRACKQRTLLVPGYSQQASLART